MMNVSSDFVQGIQGWFGKLGVKIGVLLEELRIKIANLLEKLNLTPTKIIEICSYIAVGIFIGFLLKKNFRLILFVLIGFAGLTWLLGQFNIVLINWDCVHNLLHISPNDTVGAIFKQLWHRLEQNFVIIVSGLCGFILGYRLG